MIYFIDVLKAYTLKIWFKDIFQEVTLSIVIQLLLKTLQLEMWKWNYKSDGIKNMKIWVRIKKSEVCKLDLIIWTRIHLFRLDIRNHKYAFESLIIWTRILNENLTVSDKRWRIRIMQLDLSTQIYIVGGTLAGVLLIVGLMVMILALNITRLNLSFRLDLVRFKWPSDQNIIYTKFTLREV